MIRGKWTVASNGLPVKGSTNIKFIFNTAKMKMDFFEKFPACPLDYHTFRGQMFPIPCFLLKNDDHFNRRSGIAGSTAVIYYNPATTPPLIFRTGIINPMMIKAEVPLFYNY